MSRSCRYCGRMLETVGDVCPTCGKPVGRWTDSVDRILKAAFVCAVIAGLSWGVFRVATAPPRKQPPKIEAQVSASVVQLTITNKNTFPWSGGSVTVNDIYRTRLPEVQPGEQVSAGLLTFIDDDGKRFQPMERAVKTVSLSVQFPEGESFAHYEFER